MTDLWRACGRKALALLVAAALAAPGCGSADTEQEAQQAFSEAGTSAGLPEGHPEIPPPAANATAGLEWTVPAVWELGEPHQMRVATYVIGAAEGDPVGAECAVSYFGPAQGGDVDANIQRWVGQFEQPDGGSSSAAARTGTLDVGGLSVTTVEVTGTFVATMGPMSTGTGRDNFRLLGAIVEGPEGAVFFKLVGPEKTVETARADFETLLKSMRKN